MAELQGRADSANKSGGARQLPCLPGALGGHHDHGLPPRRMQALHVRLAEKPKHLPEMSVNSGSLKIPL